jgi:hypothetical protein
LVWFETSKILFVGSPRFADSVARVVSLDAPSIQQTPGFRDAQRDFAGKPDAIGYFDATKLGPLSDPRLKSMLADYLTGIRPITASFKCVPAGLLAQLVARSAGNEPSGRVPLTPARPLTVIDRLPAETFAYAAAVTETQLSGAALQKLMLEQLAASDPEAAEQVHAGIAQIEQRLQVPFDQLLGSIGDQAAVAVVAAPSYSLTLAQPRQMLANFAIIYAQALKDDSPLRTLAKQLKGALGPLASQLNVQEVPDGYLVTPSDNAFGIDAELHFTHDFLFVALGGSALVERSWRAFSAGENTLAGEPAHRAARAALPGAARIFAWVDAGRVVDSVQKNPLLAAQARYFGISALRWSGPDRLTTALAISGEVRDGNTVYRVDSLNLPLFAGALGFAVP